MAISLASWADDLDIYLGAGNDTVTYKPNVLFIMDTSGSMSNQDGTGQTRLLRVQNALNQALAGATNINAGLMRFSDFGGPILYPVRDIDSFVQPELISVIKHGNNDAVASSGTTTLGQPELLIANGIDTQVTGLRFTQLNIPQGATITRAHLRLTSAAYQTSTVDIQIHGELTADSVDFAHGEALSIRPRTSTAVAWDEDNDFGLSGEPVISPDITAVIQEVVDQAGWCGSHDLSLLLVTSGATSDASRRAYGFEQGNGLAPQLVVEYDDATATGCVAGTTVLQISGQDENAEEKSNGYQSTGSELTFRNNANDYVGLRFENLQLPQGATIVAAHLEFTAYQNGTGSHASMRIQGVAQDLPADFNPYKRYLLRDKPKVGLVEWNAIPAWYRNNVYQSPPVTSIVQALVNRNGWAAGNDLMLVLSDFGSSRRGGYTYKGKPSGAAKLVIRYQANATPGNAATVRDYLQSKVDELTHSGMTPIVDTLYEAAQYYGGNDVYYGLQRGPSSVSSSVRRNTRVSHRLSYLGADPIRPSGCSEANLSDSDCVNEAIPKPATYLSPVTDLQCQTNNHIVLLSDGQANNNHSVDEIQTLLGRTCSGSGGEKCGIDLVRELSQTNTSPIDTRVMTHTIGFAANSTANNFLNQLALNGGGGFYQTDNSEQLVEAFQQILRTVKDVNATFVSPGVAVNQLNRLTHKDELYFALFKPAEGTIWPGNVKKYKISGDTILDQHGHDAVDTTTGFFSEYAQSFWSTLADGNDVREGGAASKLSLARQVYTFAEPGEIMTSSNQLHENNSALTTTLLGIDALPDSAVLRDNVLQWARGVDVRDYDGDGDRLEARLQMGDPIHSQPVIVNYSDTDSAILVATNHGFLHSFDAATGAENFAIIPQALLSNLYDFYQDGSSFNHLYGLDGPMQVRQFDDKTYLYIGMRRGGMQYYVIDISAKNSPKFVFTIKGGEGDYAQMGQTWSPPTLTKMRIGTQSYNVMIVGGGYDDSQDDRALRSADSQGNAIYIINADTGEALYTIGDNADGDSAADLVMADMQYAIPGRVSSIDRDQDGYVDHLYATDMGGQLFRFDIYNGQVGSALVKGARLADFGGATEADNRRFFYGPDVTEIISDDTPFYALTMGSGHRGDPLNLSIDDRFYMVRDHGVFARDEAGLFSFGDSVLEHTDLYDASEHLLNASDHLVRDNAIASLASKQGWYIRLSRDGEKVLSSPLTLDYQVFFTTYVPAAGSDSLCAPPTGNARAYLLNLLTGNAVTDLDGDMLVTGGDRSAQLNQTGIAPDTKILIENIVKPVVCLGAECAAAVIELDDEGNEIECQGEFACLVRNIYGRFERVQQRAWHSQIEQQ
jgi:type IV pilus assembly protein PilY1